MNHAGSTADPDLKNIDQNNHWGKFIIVGQLLALSPFLLIFVPNLGAGAMAIPLYTFIFESFFAIAAVAKYNAISKQRPEEMLGTVQYRGRGALKAMTVVSALALAIALVMFLYCFFQKFGGKIEGWLPRPIWLLLALTSPVAFYLVVAKISRGFILHQDKIAAGKIESNFSYREKMFCLVLIIVFAIILGAVATII